MAQEWAKPLYHSAAWGKNRNRYLKAVLDASGNVITFDGERYVRKDGTVVPESMVVPPGMCERCFAMGKLVPATLVHHKEHLTPENVSDPHVALAYDNFQRLCADCHAEVHSGSSPMRVTFDENGNVVPKHDDLRSMVLRLTETVDERRNIHSGNRKPPTT